MPVIVCINKIDRPEARPEEVIDEVLDLLIELGASEEHLDCPFVFTSAKQGKASLDYKVQNKNMEDLFETIIKYIPAPEGDIDGPLQMLISTIDYNDYIGRIGIGKIERGRMIQGEEAVIVNKLNPDKIEKIKIGKSMNLKVWKE